MHTHVPVAQIYSVHVHVKCMQMGTGKNGKNSKGDLGYAPPQKSMFFAVFPNRVAGEKN